MNKALRKMRLYFGHFGPRTLPTPILFETCWVSFVCERVRSALPGLPQKSKMGFHPKKSMMKIEHFCKFF